MIVDVAARLYDGMHDIVRRLRPSALDHLGLRDAVEGAVAAARAQHPGVAIVLATEGDLDGLGEAVNIGAYRIVQECLTNALRHSGATRIDVALRRGEGRDGARLELEVRDDGRGLGASDAGPRPRLGLLGMQERVQALGGTFAIADALDAPGVRALATIPLAVTIATTSSEVRA
jgi:signal transduction histidine kinase